MRGRCCFIPTCCCFSLKTGCIIIAVVDLIACVVLLGCLMHTQLAVTPSPVDRHISEIFEIFGHFGDAARVTCMAIAGVCGIVASGFLIEGAVKNKRTSLAVWLIFTLISSVIYLAIYTSALIIKKFDHSIVLVIGCIVLVVLVTFGLLIVLSLYRQLKAEKSMRCHLERCSVGK